MRGDGKEGLGLEMERGGMVDTGEVREYLDRKEREGTKKEGKGKEGP